MSASTLFVLNSTVGLITARSKKAEALNEIEMSSPSWLAKFKTLKHEYEHHMEEEENEVFTRAKEVISDDEIEGYGDRFEARKKEERGLIEEKKEDSLED